VNELQVTARRLLSEQSSSDRVRAAVAEAPGYDRDLWDQMVQLGWTTIHVPEAQGGAGYGYADLAVVLHELGRAVTPSPFLASAVLATGALATADNEAVAHEELVRLAEGDALGAVALASTAGSYELSRLTTTWRPAGGGVRLDGAAGFVLDADLADLLVVAARDEGGTVAALVVDGGAGVHVDPTPAVDTTRRLFRVTFDDLVVDEDRHLCAPGPEAEALLGRVLATGVVAAACDAVGTAEQALEGTTAYAKERMQFGRPIGSFQAVKHHCADMAIAVEAGRAATRAAAEALDGDPAGWATAAAVTSSYVGPAASHACDLALRVHGGIGFTWEHDSHLLLKRAKLDEVLFGTPSWHRRRLAAAVFPSLVGSLSTPRYEGADDPSKEPNR
jgi:alkylation response protein AidB-like acyl-CoA dehydrogenase